jgi:hypothetical protein
MEEEEDEETRLEEEDGLFNLVVVRRNDDDARRSCKMMFQFCFFKNGHEIYLYLISIRIYQPTYLND